MQFRVIETDLNCMNITLQTRTFLVTGILTVRKNLQQNNKLRLGNPKMFIINGGIYVALIDQKFQCIPKNSNYF